MPGSESRFAELKRHVAFTDDDAAPLAGSDPTTAPHFERIAQDFYDRGRHGSVSYRSILAGDSHACHRLHNHHALRLATFLLRHVDYAVHGQ